MKKIVLFLLSTMVCLYAFDFKAYDIGGNENTAKTSIVIKGKEFTLIPFSNMNLKVEDINLDGDFTLIFPIINGNKIEPIKLASNYKNQVIKVKVYNENILITESEDLFLDSDVVTFNLELN